MEEKRGNEEDHTFNLDPEQWYIFTLKLCLI